MEFDEVPSSNWAVQVAEAEQPQLQEAQCRIPACILILYLVLKPILRWLYCW